MPTPASQSSTPTPPKKEEESTTDALSPHAVGTGAGAVAGGAMGATLGLTGGPIGTAVGAVIGAVAGGFVGNQAAASLDPATEDDYWRKHHPEQKFSAEARGYEDYAPVYRVGYLGYREGQSFEEREIELRAEYEAELQRRESEVTRKMPEEMVPGTMQYNMSTYPLRWEDAREAARAAYERVRRGEAAPRQAS
jgi:hypothetical protein